MDGRDRGRFHRDFHLFAGKGTRLWFAGKTIPLLSHCPNIDLPFSRRVWFSEKLGEGPYPKKATPAPAQAVTMIQGGVRQNWSPQ